MTTKNEKMFAEIIEWLDRIEKALLAYFAAATIDQSAAHDRVAGAVSNFTISWTPNTIAARG